MRTVRHGRERLLESRRDASHETTMTAAVSRMAFNVLHGSYRPECQGRHDLRADTASCISYSRLPFADWPFSAHLVQAVVRALVQKKKQVRAVRHLTCCFMWWALQDLNLRPIPCQGSLGLIANYYTSPHFPQLSQLDWDVYENRTLQTATQYNAPDGFIRTGIRTTPKQGRSSQAHGVSFTTYSWQNATFHS